MKNMKKLLQKAMVFALSAAMLVGTPMTASAAGLVDLYSISDGTTNPDESYTGTVTNTNTDTDSGVLKEDYLKIVGLALDKAHLDVEKGDKNVTLTATVLLNEKDESLAATLAKMIKWQVLYADDTTAKNGVAANQVLSISASADNRSVVTLNPRQGTINGDMIVRATIDGNYYVVKNEETGEYEVKELVENKTEDYTAQATVFIKEYTTGLHFEGVETNQYVKHTYNLAEDLVRAPKTANDTITWSSSNTAIATVTAEGVVTFKKTTSVDAEGNDIPVVITAVSEKGIQASADFVVTAGTPASKVEIGRYEDENWKKLTKLDLDLGGIDEDEVAVKMWANVKSVKVDSDGKAVLKKNKPQYVTLKNLEEGATYYVWENGEAVAREVEITDDVAWATNKATIATVDGDNYGATITAAGGALGSANITAKASSGKSAKVSVKVKATLTDLKIGNAPTDLYSGQSVQLTADRTPALNKDAVKWSIAKVDYLKGDKIKTKANPNATIKNGLLTIKPKLDADYLSVTVVLETKAAVKDEDGNKVPAFADSVTIKLKQSNVESITVQDDTADNAIIATVTWDSKKKKAIVNAGLKGAKNTTNIKVPKTQSYTITAPTADGSAENTLDVKTSNAKVAAVSYDQNGTARITANAKGSATVTVSGVREGKAIKTTFKVAVTQPTTSLTMNKTLVVLKDTNKNLSASFSVKQNKDAKEKITWSVDPDKGETKASITNKGKVTIKKGDYKAGDEFTVTAKSESGVTATATIKIVTTSTGVRVVDEEGKPFSYTNTKKKLVKNATTLGLGDSVELLPQVNVTKKAPDNGWVNVGTDDKLATVEYSVNKKGIVQIIGNTVYRVGNGTVKITVKTTDGKKYTLTIDDPSKELAPSEE